MNTRTLLYANDEQLDVTPIELVDPMPGETETVTDEDNLLIIYGLTDIARQDMFWGNTAKYDSEYCVVTGKVEAAGMDMSYDIKPKIHKGLTTALKETIGTADSYRVELSEDGKTIFLSVGYINDRQSVFKINILTADACDIFFNNPMAFIINNLDNYIKIEIEIE